MDLTLKVREPEYASWVTWSPEGNDDVEPGECNTFDVTITGPADASGGSHTFHIDSLGDGVVVGTTTVTKHVSGEIPAPEFPTIALPIAMIIGLAFVVISVRSRKDN